MAQPLSQLFETLVQRKAALAEIGEEIRRLDDTKELLHGIFVDRDQWSHNANWHYAQLMERTRFLEDKRQDLTSDIGRRRQLQNLLAKFGATEQAMAVLAGSVLQLAKQTLSFRFGAKSNLPPGQLVGTQPQTEVIWEGRNHALHWEEGRKGTPAHTMLLKLEADGLANITFGENNSLAILDALEWNSAADVMSSLNQLVE